MSNYVYAVWFPADATLSDYEKRIHDISSLSGKSLDEVREMVSERAKSRPIAHVDAATFIYDYYLTFWEFPND